MAFTLNTQPKPSTPTDLPNPQRSAFANQVAGKIKSKPKPIVSRGGDENRVVKIMSYGHTGTGKSLAIKGFVEAGLKVLVVSTDVGGSGMASVYAALQDEGKADLIKNIVDITFTDYESIIDFFKDPTEVLADIYDFGFDLIAWDGFTGYQQSIVMDKVSEIDPLSSKASEGRKEGLWDEQQDWGMIRKATVRGLTAFLNFSDWKNARPWHKYLTCLEQKPKQDTLTQEVQRAPFIQGSAGSLLGPAFDIVFQTRATAVENGGRRYEYYCVGHDKLLAKSRGYGLEPVEPANMKVLWETKIMPRLKFGKVESEE